MSTSVPDHPGLLDVGDLATWSVSSSKPGFGVEQLRDGNTVTLWQSEGPQPHVVKIAFARQTAVAQISMYTDVAIDDSYTPSKIAISAGTFSHDLQLVKMVELSHPKGWQNFRLGSAEEGADADAGEDEDADEDEGAAVTATLFQITILANHLSGKDTHVRAIKIFSPKPNRKTSDGLKPFTTDAFLMHRTVR